MEFNKVVETTIIGIIMAMEQLNKVNNIIMKVGKFINFAKKVVFALNFNIFSKNFFINKRKKFSFQINLIFLLFYIIYIY